MVRKNDFKIIYKIIYKNYFYFIGYEIQERFETIKTHNVGGDIRVTKIETVQRRFPTVYDVHMRKMTGFGASGGTCEDEIKILPGVGRNSPSYELPYNESQSG